MFGLICDAGIAREGEVGADGHDFAPLVPELASRHHLGAVVPVVDEALERAGMGLDALDALAVTEGPGLVGALLVGAGFARALGLALGIPVVGVHHMGLAEMPAIGGGEPYEANEGMTIEAIRKQMAERPPVAP